MGQEAGFLGGLVDRLRTAFRTSLFRNSFFLLLRSSVNYLLGFLFWLVVARSYDAEVWGVGAAILSLTLLLARGAAMGLPMSLLRFLPAERDKNGLINACFTASGLVALIVGVGFLVGLDVWAPSVAFIRSDVLLASALLVSLLFFTLDGVVDNAFVAARRADYGIIRTSIFYGLRLPFAVGLVVWGLLGIVVSWTISLVVSVVAAALLLPRFFPGYRPRLALRPLRDRGMLGFSLWTYGTSVVAAASSSLLPILILNVLGTDGGATVAAHFYAAYAIASLLYNIPHSFSTSLLVEGSYAPMNMGVERRKSLRYSGPLLAVGILGAIALGSPLLELFGTSFVDSYLTLVVLVLASPILLVTGIFSADLQVDKRARPIFLVTLLSTGTTFGIAYALLPTAGALGVAAGVIAGQSTRFLLYFLLRHTRKPASGGSG
jgi:O-antigen/teichoic acid export membrane protein